MSWRLGKLKRASTYAAIDETRSVPVSEPASTIAVLMKKRPMCAWVHAREKLSHCRAAGSVHGLDRISGSVFNAVTIIQTKGKMTTIVQKASRSWDTALKVRLPNP